MQSIWPKSRKTILILDELDKTKERVEELLLRGLETLTLRMFSEEVKADPENLVIIATSNNNRELMKPTYRRFDIRLKTEFPCLETQKEIIDVCLTANPSNRTKYTKILAEAGIELRNMIGAEDAPSYSELAKIGDIVYAMSSMDNKLIEEVIKGSLDKGFYDRGETVKLSFNLIKALKTCL